MGLFLRLPKIGVLSAPTQQTLDNQILLTRSSGHILTGRSSISIHLKIVLERVYPLTRLDQGLQGSPAHCDYKDLTGLILRYGFNLMPHLASPFFGLFKCH